MHLKIYTKTRHIDKIKKFLDLMNFDYKIYTVFDYPDSHESYVTSDYDMEPFDLGISYCYPRKILDPLLSAPKLGFVNFHPAPLPEYKGPTELIKAIQNQEIKWGVTAHYMTPEYDSGKIIRMMPIELNEPPTDQHELGAISHFFLFKLFKQVITDFKNGKPSLTKGQIQKSC